MRWPPIPAVTATGWRATTRCTSTARSSAVGIVAVDVTERRQAEDFRSIVMNNMAEGLFTVDAHGRLTSMNAAATKALGWTEKELLGTEMRDALLVQASGDESIEEGNRKLLSVRGERRHVRLDDHVYRCKNGSVLPVAISASPLLTVRRRLAP